jgi:signal peptidase I
MMERHEATAEAGTRAERTTGRGRRAARGKSAIREYVEAIVLAIALTVVIRGLVVQAFRIPSGSMEDTLLTGDFLFVNKMIYGSEIDIGYRDYRLVHHRFPAIRRPQRGDIIVFRFPEDPGRDFIKRCVAVEGQRVEVRDKILYVDGTRMEEPFAIHTDPSTVPRGTNARDNFGPVVVPKGHIFMMGDNRDNSLDSRFWGPLPVDLVKGKAMILYWSWDAARNQPRLNRLFHVVR